MEKNGPLQRTEGRQCAGGKGCACGFVCTDTVTIKTKLNYTAQLCFVSVF